MNNHSHPTPEIIEVCLLAGKLMMQNGAETYRVEDTMSRIALAYGISQSHSYVTPTGIFFAINDSEPAKLIRIVERTTDLHKVVEVNAISRKISRDDLSPRAAVMELSKIERGPLRYSNRVQLMAAALASGCFMIMFGGVWRDFPAAVLCGGAGFAAVQYFHRLVKVKFFSEFSASFFNRLVGGLTDSYRLGPDDGQNHYWLRYAVGARLINY